MDILRSTQMHRFFRNISKTVSLALRYHTATAVNIPLNFSPIKLSVKGGIELHCTTLLKEQNLANSTRLIFSKISVPFPLLYL